MPPIAQTSKMPGLALQRANQQIPVTKAAEILMPIGTIGSSRHSNTNTTRLNATAKTIVAIGIGRRNRPSANAEFTDRDKHVPWCVPLKAKPRPTKQRTTGIAMAIGAQVSIRSVAIPAITRTKTAKNHELIGEYLRIRRATEVVPVCDSASGIDVSSSVGLSFRKHM
jgi:vacuolar-type H+-ATPase catalytic subunit A/Vma1